MDNQENNLYNETQTTETTADTQNQTQYTQPNTFAQNTQYQNAQFQNTQYQSNQFQNAQYQYQYQGVDNTPLTVGQWMITLLVLALPCLINIIMAFVWAFGNGNENRKRFCRAWLIWMAIGIGVSVLLVIILAAAGYSLAGAFASGMYY